MALQNRVSPFGAIEAVDGRGTLMGNRGVLHDADRRLGAARWRHPHWITCRLQFKARHRRVMAPGRYTELFFLDEAVSFAAGHRPCAECRRADYRRFLGAMRGDRLRAADIDRDLHEARVDSRSRDHKTFGARLADLPAGAFFRFRDAPHEAWVVDGRNALRFSYSGYDRLMPIEDDLAIDVLTPRPMVEAFRRGYCPRLHPSASRPWAMPK